MRAGLAVLAAAPGTVRALRDGWADGAFLAGADLAGKGCGNGVGIDRGGGWQTQLYHIAAARSSLPPGPGSSPARRLAWAVFPARPSFRICI